jgi:hypothetical protein
VRVALLAVLFLASCGVGTQASKPAPRATGRIDVYEVTVLPEGADADSVGRTVFGDETNSVYVLETADHQVFHIAIHELMHAMGLVEHETDPDCFLAPVIDPALTHLCDHEHERLALAAVPTDVYIHSENVRPSFEDAAAFLNAQLGWDAYSVVP